MDGAVCLMGGSFNPPHRGHLLMVERALQRLRPARVVVVPAGRPPHKHRRLAPAPMRLAMARLAFQGVPGVEVSDEEILKPGPSYTVETLEAWRRALGPDVPLYWLVGTDALADLPGWKDHHRILSLCRVASVPRPGHPIDLVDDSDTGFTARERRELRRHFLGGEEVDISSSAVRDRLEAGASVDHMVPAGVVRFIREHGLYGTGRAP